MAKQALCNQCGQYKAKGNFRLYYRKLGSKKCIECERKEHEMDGYTPSIESENKANDEIVSGRRKRSAPQNFLRESSNYGIVSDRVMNSSYFAMSIGAGKTIDEIEEAAVQAATEDPEDELRQCEWCEYSFRNLLLHQIDCSKTSYKGRRAR